MRKLSVTLSDGTVLSVRSVQANPVTTVFVEVPDYARPCAQLTWNSAGAFCLVFGDRLVPVEGAYAGTVRDAARVALDWFAAGAESVIDHAAREGIDVIDCY